jgi:hypothetical protein
MISAQTRSGFVMLKEKPVSTDRVVAGAHAAPDQL